MPVLLDRNNGDSYFVKRLKTLIEKYINNIMNLDGEPEDGLRIHFVQNMVELHFLSALTWLDQKDRDFLSVEDIVNLLNTMRVGSVFLTYKRATDPYFTEKMHLDQKS